MKTETLPLYLGNANEEIIDDISRAVSGRWIRRGRDQIAEHVGGEPETRVHAQLLRGRL